MLSIPVKFQNLPPPSRFMFWCTAPFLVATLVLLPLFAKPPSVGGWIALGAAELLGGCVLLGLYHPSRFWWCWRVAGAVIFAAYLAYLIAMARAGQWMRGGRPTTTSAFNALVGLVVFGYPGLMYAMFGRFTWRREEEYDDDDDGPWEIDDAAADVDAEGDESR
jgi:hypothetical protein